MRSDESADGGVATLFPTESRSPQHTNPFRAIFCWTYKFVSAWAARMKANNAHPKHESASSIHTMVEILTREQDHVNPSPGEWREVFLQALARAPIVSVAAAMAGVSTRRAIDERNTDANFARHWADAVEQGVDEIEAAAYLSAVFGQKRPVFHQGKQVGWTSNDSHAMQSMFLKARRPQVFGEKEKTAGREDDRADPRRI